MDIETIKTSFLIIDGIEITGVIEHYSWYALFSSTGITYLQKNIEYSKKYVKNGVIDYNHIVKTHRQSNILVIRHSIRNITGWETLTKNNTNFIDKIYIHSGGVTSEFIKNMDNWDLSNLKEIVIFNRKPIDLKVLSNLEIPKIKKIKIQWK